MNIRCLSFAVLLLFLVTGCAGGAGQAPPESAEVGSIRSVKSGDTIVLQTGAMKPVQVRLFGIDAPEIGQSYVGKAHKRLRELTTTSDIRYEVTSPPGVPHKEVLLYADGKLVNSLLVSEGLAWVVPGIEDANLLEAFSAAQQNKRGLWKDNRQIPPWDFRGARSAERNQNSKQMKRLHAKDKPSVVDYRSRGLRDQYYYYDGYRYRKYKYRSPKHQNGYDPTVDTYGR